MHGATETLVAPGVEIDAEVLVTLARACRDAVRVRFGYAARDGEERGRLVEPVRMVTTGRRWYLMAWDVDRDDWRTFRLDRMREVAATTWRFAAREYPDPVDYVHRSVTGAPYRYLARVRVHAPPERVRELVPPQVARVEDDRDGWCVLVVGGDDLDWIAVHVARLAFEAEVLGPPELREAAARMARRLAAMSGTG
ncbi:helix-turn-helix transcriptional regulator [Nocardiopsis sediminis]|uniref:Helix-turn-helix transcriptional regulator n=1 Tax=Nocardiopsis sediminis TaxID=1778267 RepID=A0ABV8FPS2_9ACTN